MCYMRVRAHACVALARVLVFDVCMRVCAHAYVRECVRLHVCVCVSVYV